MTSDLQGEGEPVIADAVDAQIGGIEAPLHDRRFRGELAQPGFVAGRIGEYAGIFAAVDGLDDPPVRPRPVEALPIVGDQGLRDGYAHALREMQQQRLGYASRAVAPVEERNIVACENPGQHGVVPAGRPPLALRLRRRAGA